MAFMVSDSLEIAGAGSQAESWLRTIASDEIPTPKKTRIPPRIL
jgi:hypothetical protein